MRKISESKFSILKELMFIVQYRNIHNIYIYIYIYTDVEVNTFIYKHTIQIDMYSTGSSTEYVSESYHIPYLSYICLVEIFNI